MYGTVRHQGEALARICAVSGRRAWLAGCLGCLLIVVGILRVLIRPQAMILPVCVEYLHLPLCMYVGNQLCKCKIKCF